MIVRITKWEVTHTKNCPRLTWQGDPGLCEVDVFLSFLQKDNSTLKVVVPFIKRYYEHCWAIPDFLDIYYKTITYIRNKNGVKTRISQNIQEKKLPISPLEDIIDGNDKSPVYN